MKKVSITLLAFISSLMMMFSLQANADQISNSVTGVNGYDLVSYQTGKKPLQGNGHYVATVDGVNYLFVNQSNLDAFNKAPEKYLPQYGGFCAYGAAKGKKFIGDPTVWEVVDGKLYFNLDNNIKSAWVKDIPGHIKAADKKWKKIKNVPANKL